MAKKTTAYLKEESLLTLLSQNNFIVPEIQREYVWGENEKVINKFLNDLKNKIGICCDNCNLPSSENKINIGFLYSYKPDYVKIEHNRFLDENLIDGQQRFTTLFLLLFFCALKERKTDGKNRKDEFLLLIRFEEKLSMCFDFKVRDLTKRFMLELIEKIDTIESLENIDKQTWYLKDYQNDVSIKSIRKALGYIQIIFSGNTKYYNHLISNVFFWHFKTEATSQGEELYITMNARGEELADNEVTKAALMIGGSQIFEWGRKWEEWQQYFWVKRDKNEKKPSADKGLNGFLACIAGLEYYLNKKEGLLVEKDIQKLLTLEKVEIYYNVLKLLEDKRNDFELNYNYKKWIQKCIEEIWDIFNKNDTDWFADYNDKNKSTDRNRMVFIWSWLYYVSEQFQEKTNINSFELFRILRFFYLRFKNFNRSVSTLKKTIDLIIINGIWDTVENEMENDEGELEEETDSKFRTAEESIKNKYFQNNILNEDLLRKEELIWQIEDHPLNLDGSDVGNINLTHLLELKDSTSVEEIEKVKNVFFKLFPDGTKIGSVILKTLLLHYGVFYKTSVYGNGRKYDFSDWKRNIRKKEFKLFIEDIKAKDEYKLLEYLNKEHLNKFKNEIENSILSFKNGFDFRHKLIFYSLILMPEGLWECGSIIIEYKQIESLRLFEDEDKLLINLKSDFRSYNIDLWIKAKEKNENPLMFIKNKLI